MFGKKNKEIVRLNKVNTSLIAQIKQMNKVEHEKPYEVFFNFSLVNTMSIERTYAGKTNIGYFMKDQTEFNEWTMKTTIDQHNKLVEMANINGN
jgi:hypothetical protein